MSHAASFNDDLPGPVDMSLQNLIIRCRTSALPKHRVNMILVATGNELVPVLLQ